MSEPQSLNPFDATVATLTKEFPLEFRLEVDEYAFRDVGSMDQAREIRRTMEGMKHEASAMGYEIAITHDHMNFRWVYAFKRPANAVRPDRVEAVDVANVPSLQA